MKKPNKLVINKITLRDLDLQTLGAAAGDSLALRFVANLWATSALEQFLNSQVLDSGRNNCTLVLPAIIPSLSVFLMLRPSMRALRSDSQCPRNNSTNATRRRRENFVFDFQLPT